VTPHTITYLKSDVKYFYLFFGFLDFWTFGLSQLTSLQFILYHLAGFYKPTITQSVPSHLQNYSIQYATMVSNSQPFSYDSSALTTRTRLLAKIYFCLSNFLRIKYSKRNLIYFYFLTFNTKVKF